MNAAYSLSKHLAENPVRYSHVINLGSTGSHVFPNHSVVEASAVVQRDMDATGIGTPFGDTPFDSHPGTIECVTNFPHLKNGVCGTGDSFLQSPPPIPCDVVNMEAYALAKVCLREQVPFTCVKYITDGADHNASNDWEENVKKAAAAFLTLLETIS